MKLSFFSFLTTLAVVVLFTACEEGATSDHTYNMLEANEAPTEAKDRIEPTGDVGENTEQYDAIVENEFKSVKQNQLSTFAIDVDRASYANTRRFLMSGNLPPKNAVRIEEFINYFHYDYEQPTGEHPFSVTTEISEAPWNPEHRLAHIGLKGQNISFENAPANNLVFLIDVSGSMGDPKKLPLLKEGFRLLVDNLRPTDRVAIVTYAGAEGLVLGSTPGTEKDKILHALGRLESGGSTAGAAGINLAYKTALKNYIEGGNNRVILATDGDFNVGISKDADLVRLIEKRRTQGVFLSVLGFGTGNLKDSKMEKLADNGNGNYAYIDNINEAKKVFVTEMSGTLLTIAKDVKLQLEFNPKYVKSYRLIGYENRLLKDEEFDDDTKDAGDMGAGHSVTALYEIIPKRKKLKEADLFNVKLRYKSPEANTSKLFEHQATDYSTPLESTSNNFRFSASVAGFGMLLRDSQYKNGLTYDEVAELGRNAKGVDLEGYREEYLQLIEQAKMVESTRAVSEN